MSFPVTVRDMDHYHHCLAAGKSPVAGNREISENSRILQGIIPYAAPALPKYELTRGEVVLLADTAAYLVRTDLVKRNVGFYDHMHPIPEKAPQFIGENGSPRLLHDPRLIVPGFELRTTGLYDKLCHTGAEWFRCFAAALTDSKLFDKVTDKNNLGPAFVLADVTTFLLDPTELVDYTYSNDENRAFEKRMAKRWEEI